MPGEFRTVNRVLGDQPRLGPFPADQIVPWTGIFLFGVLVVNQVFQASWFVTGLFIAWGWATWWTLSSSKAYLGKFVATPRVVRGYKRYVSLVNPPPPLIKNKKQKNK
ncbi:unknown protein (plasmid) [Calothrix sp. PCC 7716]|nr:unknown protein [Calothrix sp. PCC 7716]